MPQGDGQRVLVVDDEEPLVRLATETLEELGYAPVGFTSSAAALEAFRADPKGFDAVITDERMPGMSGSALIRAVRGIRRSVPIVLVSGYVGGYGDVARRASGRRRSPEEAAVGARARDEPRARAAGLAGAAVDAETRRASGSLQRAATREGTPTRGSRSAATGGARLPAQARAWTNLPESY